MADEARAGVPRAGFAFLLTLSMAQFMVVLDFTIANVALPSIQHGLHIATTPAGFRNDWRGGVTLTQPPAVPCCS